MSHLSSQKRILEVIFFLTQYRDPYNNNIFVVMENTPQNIIIFLDTF